MQHTPHRPMSLGTACPHDTSLHDVGELPSSIVATQVAEISDDFCALRLCCKAAYGAGIPVYSSNRSSSSSNILHSTSQIGISRQTTLLHLASRVFLEPPVASNELASPCQATQMLSHHPAVTTLLISQPSNLVNPRQILLHAVPNALPLLLRLSISLRDEEILNGMAAVVNIEIDAACIARLHCLTHLTLHLCSLAPGFSEILAQLALLTVLHLDGSTGLGNLTFSDLAALQLVSMEHTDVSTLTFNNCKALESLNARASRSLVDCSISGSPSLTHLRLNGCRVLPRVDVRACAALEHLEVADCSVLTELLASGCCNLTTLFASTCALLTHMDIRGCSKLALLCVDELSPEQLDPHVQAALIDLTVQSNELSFLPLLPQLQELTLYSCIQFSMLDLASYTQLQCLILVACDALASICVPSCLQHLILNNCSQLLVLDTSQLSQLKQLSLEECNGLQLLDVFHLAHLTSLSVKECNSLTALAVSNCPMLNSVKVVSCCLADLVITHLLLLTDVNLASPKPRYGHIDVTVIQVQLQKCPTLANLTVKHTGVETLDVSCLSALQRMDASGCASLSEIDASGCASLQGLVLSGCSNMQRLNLTGTTCLCTLRMVGCTDLVDENPQLLDGSNLSDIHLSFNSTMPSPTAYTYLTHLHVEGCNEITAMDLSIFPNLRMLMVTSCPLLERLGVTGLHLLRILIVSECNSLMHIGGTWSEGRTRRVSPVFGGSLPDEFISQIRQLHITDCALQNLDLAFFPYLKDLSFKQCNELLALETRYCRGLKHLKMDTCEAISNLDVSNDFLCTLELVGMSSLLHLNLEGCTDLKSVHLSDSAIADLEFQKCHCLHSLSLGKLPSLARIIAVGLPSLTHVLVSECPKLQELNLSGSTACLDDICVGPESPISTLDLTLAPLLRERLLPAIRSTQCAVCLTGAITHAFLHSRIAHCVCSSCAKKVSCSHDGTEAHVPNALICLLCLAPSQLALIR